VRQSAPHCLQAPLHYESNYAYPLVVWLHAAGGDERELSQVMQHVSLRNYVSLSVRGIVGERRGFDWPQTADSIYAAELRLADAVEQACQRFNVHPERIFLMGHGSGGTTAIRIALGHSKYAGAISLGGAFPEGHSPLLRLAQARQTRLLIAHCRDSLTYPMSRLCQELSLFHAAGLSVTLRQYPCGDELTTQMLHDVDVWLMEQVTGLPANDDQAVHLPSDWN
jgi:phospholipase/carboxylesterase